MTTGWLDEATKKALQTLEEAGLRRFLPELNKAENPALTDMASNDYLGLARDERVKERAAEKIRHFGAGGTSSRLINGHLRFFAETEEKLAAFKKTEAALVFPSGFQANITVLPALMKAAGGSSEVAVYADRLNHISLHLGLQLSGVRQIRYRHNDLDHLENLLKRDTAKKCRRLIVTESVFSMDGDQAPLAGLIQVASRFGASLYVDEAHATGVLGHEGRGLAADFPGQVDVVMGTLGKALGGSGAFVAASKAVIDFLITEAKGFIYTTAPSPAAFGALEAALTLVPGMDTEREKLRKNGRKIRKALLQNGLISPPGEGGIIPILLKKPLAAQAFLAKQGIMVAGVRSPSVAKGQERLRVTLNALLTDDEIAHFIALLPQIREVGA